MVTLEQNKIINGNGKGEKKINRLARKCVVDLITWREWLLALCKEKNHVIPAAYHFSYAQIARSRWFALKKHNT